MHVGVLNGREISKGKMVCICMADSFRCAMEANNIVKQLYGNKN